MKLSGRPLIDVCNVNDYINSQQVEMFEKDPLDFYLQLYDGEKNLAQHGYSPPGLRYMPASGATMTAQFLNLNSAKQFTRAATQPFAQDASIWKIPILSTDPLKGTVSIKLTLTEGSVIRTVFMQAVLLVKDVEGIC